MKRLAVIGLLGLGWSIGPSLGADQVEVERTVKPHRYAVIGSSHPATILSKPVVASPEIRITEPAAASLPVRRLSYATIPVLVQPSALRPYRRTRQSELTRKSPLSVRRQVRESVGSVRTWREFPVVTMATPTTPESVWFESVSMDDVNRDTLRQDFSRDQGLLRRQAGHQP